VPRRPASSARCLGRSLGSRLLLDRRRHRGLVGGSGLGRGLLPGGRPGLRLVGGVLERLVEELGLVPLGLGHPQGALGARQALELLPVAGDLEDRLDGLGRLRADPSQYCARSEVTSMNEGSCFGWYLPISSMTLPSRFFRPSTTTTR
jgi:hypothetical protein